MGSVHRIAVAVAVFWVESAVGSNIVKSRTTAVQAVLPAKGHAVGSAVEHQGLFAA